jgi:hypothetical protein
MATKQPSAKIKNQDKNRKNTQSNIETANKSQNSVRTRKLSRRTQKKVDKSIKRTNKLPAAWTIFGRSVAHLWRYKKLFAGILIVFGICNLLLVKGIAGNFQLTAVRDSIKTAFGDSISTWSTTVTLFGLLIGSTSRTNGESGSVYQLFLLLIISLALIWALRRTYEKPVKLRIRDSFYKGMYPFIPLLLVLLVIMLQLLPMLITSSLYGIVQSGALANNLAEKTAWLVLLLAGTGLTVYMLSASVFAIYIVTLPDMTPIRALRAARKLVKFRRVAVIRKILFLPLAILLAATLIFLPLVYVLPVAAEALYLVASIFLLGIIHSYGYALYRELL